MKANDRFWNHVLPEPNSGCWLWTGYRNSKGYGRFSFEGRPQVASRVSWVLSRGSLPDGEYVLHRCDTPACVNPDHLFLGTMADNSKDCARKGRHSRGERRWNARLTKDDVVSILRSDDSTLQLSRKYGVSWATIYDIRTGATWKHVSVAETTL